MSILDDVSGGFDLPVAQAHVPHATALADKFLHVTLYVTILSSFFVFVEPAPYEYLAIILMVACVVARVRFNRMILPLVALLLVRDASGAMALLQILDYPDASHFLATSFYLSLTAIMFACIFAQDSERRIATLRSAYIASAVLASLFGTIGFFDLYFKFIPGLEVFSLNDRAVAGFKDPNVLGCFLLPPLMWLIEGLVVGKLRIRNLLAIVIIFVGLLLAFSRAAWGSFVFATAFLLYFLYITQKGRKPRTRIIFFMVGSAIAGVAIFIALLSIDAVRDMFLQRATLLEEYDTGRSGTRFVLQQNALREMLDHPFGMGPWGFMRVYGWVSHNSYLGTMLNNGWAGGIAYITLTVLTLGVGFRAMMVRTPWQTFLMGAYMPYVALVLEAFVVDTDHWRHYYLLLGIIWGLAAATRRAIRRGLPAEAAEPEPIAA